MDSRNVKQTGFTLVEVMVVTVIIATLSVAFLLNFRGSATSETARHRTSFIVLADIRLSQTMALAGSNLEGQSVCGYGIHYLASNRYALYAGVPEGGPSSCSAANRNYQQGIDLVVNIKDFQNQNMEIKGGFSDIFFESPDPKAYINGQTLPTVSTATINIGALGQSCPQDCTSVSVSTSGQIEVTN